MLSLGAFPDDPPTPEPVAAPNMGRSPRTSITLGQCVSSGGELGVTPGAEAIGPVVSAALTRANTLLADRCSVRDEAVFHPGDQATNEHWPSLHRTRVRTR